jgi:hypothetical protein
MAAAAARNLEALAYEPGLWIVATGLLSDFTLAGARLGTQAAALGQWLAQTLTAATRLAPPQRDAESSTALTRQPRPRKGT